MAVRLAVLMQHTFLKGQHSLAFAGVTLLPLTCVGRPIRIDPDLVKSWQKSKLQQNAVAIAPGTPRDPSARAPRDEGLPESIPGTSVATPQNRTLPQEVA